MTAESGTADRQAARVCEHMIVVGSHNGVDLQAALPEGLPELRIHL